MSYLSGWFVSHFEMLPQCSRKGSHQPWDTWTLIYDTNLYWISDQPWDIYICIWYHTNHEIHHPVLDIDLPIPHQPVTDICKSLILGPKLWASLMLFSNLHSNLRYEGFTEFSIYLVAKNLFVFILHTNNFGFFAP